MTGYRILFALAAIYNLAFGAWAGFFPAAFFEWFDLAPPRYPAIWSCLGMVVGVYAIAYAAIAWRPRNGSLLAAIGLVGKVLGPLGWVWAVRTGQLPPRTFPLILANDLIWWYPFVAYLLRNVSSRRTLLAWIAIAANAAACLGLLLVAPGTESEVDPARRAEFVQAHTARWAAVWVSWTLASMGLVAFFSVWGAVLVDRGAARTRTLFAVVVAAIGVVADLAGETVNIAVLTGPGLSLDEFARHAQLYTLLGPATANGLYCLAGLVLSLLSWYVGLLRGLAGLAGFATWSLGLALTAAALLGNHQAMVVTGAGVMGLFIVWGAYAAMGFSPSRAPDR